MERDGRQQIVDQVAYLLDEVAALKGVLHAVPEELLQAQPYPGEPSVRELFEMLAAREAGVRARNVERILSGGEDVVLETNPLPLDPEEASSRTTVEVLDDLESARSRLVDRLSQCGSSAWRVVAAYDGKQVNLEDYLYGLIQEDVAVLQTAARRIHESRPTRSPGFTSR
ncbi:MAG: hypothetical protein R3282_08785 [Rhodothermales bacterium]|nr:hypothetical protein [Rhodothermales bacterium]